MCKVEFLWPPFLQLLRPAESGRAPPPVSLLVFVLGVSVIVSAPAFMRFVLLIIYALRQQSPFLQRAQKNAKSERPTFCELYLGERKALGMEIQICIFAALFSALSWLQSLTEK
jgi:hypothetical protein